MTHADLMAGYYALREAQEASAEQATSGYASELSDYWHEHPRVTFRRYLVEMTGR